MIANKFTIVTIHSGNCWSATTGKMVYKVIADNGTEWFAGSYQECEDFIYQYNNKA